MDKELSKKEVKEPEVIAENTAEVAPEAVVGDETEATSEVAQETTNANSEWIELVKKYNPEADTSSPQAILDAILPTVQKMVVLEEKIIDLVNTDDASAAALNDWIDLGSLPKAIARNFDPEEITALIEEINDEENEPDRAAFNEKITARKTRESELETNRSESQVTAQAFLDKINPSEEDLEGFIKYHGDFVKDAVDNKMTLDHWERQWKAYKYDGDMEAMNGKVSEAEENGKIIGRNETQKTEKLKQKDIANLLPETGGGSGIKPREDKPKSFASNFMNGVL